MKITKITVQQKNSSRYSIFVDNQYAFSLSDIGLLDSGLVTGQEVTEEAVEKLKDLSELDKYYQKILNLLSLRARSSYEIETYLKRHDCPSSMTKIILNKLSKNNYINDNLFAISWINNRQLLRPRSKIKLISELREKGLSKEVISQAMDEVDIDDSTALLSIIEKKRKLSKFKDDTKLIQYLISQGFNYYDIKKQINLS
jgi:regulatory protein